MKCLFPRNCLTLALAFFLSARLVHAAAPAGELTAEQIMKKTIERAKTTRAAKTQNNYSYTKVSVTEEFDGKGKLSEKKEKVLEFKQGYGQLSALKLNGRSITGAEFRKLDEAAIHARQEVTDSKSDRRDDNWEKYLTAELIAKYSFKLIGQEPINGRSAYVVGFEPASDNLPVDRLIDRLTNRLGGKIWIDEEDFEIARAQVALRSEVNLWRGVLGNLRKCNFTVERSRVDDQVWFDTLTNGEFEGRKLLDATHVRTRSESSNFRKAVQRPGR
jgi:hypothetical protein